LRKKRKQRPKKKKGGRNKRDSRDIGNCRDQSCPDTGDRSRK
jgi:hypothetical protein